MELNEQAILAAAKAKVAPPSEIDEAAVLALPRTDAVWFADSFSATQDDESSTSGFCTTLQFKVALVEKEKGSNGVAWDGCEGDCDGLSHCLALCVIAQDTETESLFMSTDGMLKTISKACLDNVHNLAPHGRPRKILLSRKGWVRELKPALAKLGIKSVGVADEDLKGSMAASFSRPPTVDADLAQGGFDQQTSSILAAFATHSSTSTSVYVSEKRERLRGWRDQFKSAVPHEWYVRRPNPHEQKYGGWRPRMMWGWRTNMELAVERNDAAKIADLSARYPREDVVAYIEMRLLLTSAATKGLLRSVEALLAAGAHVDGVLAKSNKEAWRAMQIESGDDGQGRSQTPLNRAAQHGHTAIVALLLRHGANPSLVNACQRAGPLTYAVMRAHRDCVELLVDGGADVNLSDDQGHTPLSLCRYMVDETGQSRYQSILTLLESAADGGGGGSHGGRAVKGGLCAVCGKAGARAKCVCGTVFYCDKTCQKSHWKAHKAVHKLLMVVGKSVVVTGTSRDDYNGQPGKVTSFEQQMDPPRYVVVLDGSGKKVKLKPENVSVVEEG